jgi:hydrogenase-4 component F
LALGTTAVKVTALVAFTAVVGTRVIPRVLDYVAATRSRELFTLTVLVVALGIAFAAVFSKVQPMVFGDTTATRLPHPPALLPVFVHLALALMLGLYIPPYLATWYREAAKLIG